jgi:hypothetical protein
MDVFGEINLGIVEQRDQQGPKSSFCKLGPCICTTSQVIRDEQASSVHQISLHKIEAS